MKKIILTILSIVTFSSIVFSSKDVYCMDPELWNALGFDPNASSVSVSLEELEARTANAARNHPELFTDDFVQSVGGTPQGQSNPAPSQPSSEDNGKKGKKPAASEKIMVYFTDCYGHVIGKTEVTAGTTITGSQFPASVEPVNGNAFDKWDYDNKELYHDMIVRAVYK